MRILKFTVFTKQVKNRVNSICTVIKDGLDGQGIVFCSRLGLEIFFSVVQNFHSDYWVPGGLFVGLSGRGMLITHLLLF
jgi:hypothetical protein